MRLFILCGWLVAFSSHENSLRHLLSMVMNRKHGYDENWNRLKWATVNWMSDWKRDGSTGSEWVGEKLEKSTADGKKVEYITRWMGRMGKKLYRFLCQSHFVVELLSCFEASVFTCLLLCDMASPAAPQHDAHFADVKSIFSFYYVFHSCTTIAIVMAMNFGTWLKIRPCSALISWRMFPMSTSFENTVSPSHCNVLLTTYQSHFGLLLSAHAKMLHCTAEWVAKHQRNPLTFKLNFCLSTMKSCRKRLHFNIIVIFFVRKWKSWQNFTIL